MLESQGDVGLSGTGEPLTSRTSGAEEKIGSIGEHAIQQRSSTQQEGGAEKASHVAQEQILQEVGAVEKEGKKHHIEQEPEKSSVEQHVEKARSSVLSIPQREEDSSSLKATSSSDLSEKIEGKRKSLDKVIDRASSLLGMGKYQVRETLSQKEHLATLAKAFEAQIARVVFPGEKEDPTRNGEEIDGLPPFAADMTLREKMLLGAIATIFGKTEALENLCKQSNQEGSIQYEMVTIDPSTGRQLEILPFGVPKENSPCILMEGGLGQGANTWEKTIKLLPNAYGLSYSRAGIGLSDSSPNAGSMERALEDLSALISKLEKEGKIHKPYILVGHSYGGFIMQAYAKMHTSEIKGLVLVDSSIESFSAEKEEERLSFIDFHPELMPRRTEELLFPFSTNLKTFFTENNRFQENATILRKSIELHEKTSKEPFLGELPLQVLTRHPKPSEAMSAFEVWQKGQETLSLRSSNATWAVAHKGVGHNIEQDDPQLVAQAIKTLL